MNSGDQVNYALTKAIVEEKTIFLDDYRVFTYNTDYALSPAGKILADREPGISLMAIPFYYLGKLMLPVTNLPYGGYHPSINRESSLQMWSYSSIIFFVAYCFVLLFYFLLRLGISKKWGLLTIIFIAFGTLMWKYSSSFSRHPVVAMCLTLSIVLILLFFKKGSRNDFFILLSGLFFGLASFTDYIAWISAFLVWIGLTLKEKRIKSSLFFLTGFLPFLFFAFIYNYFAFGKIITSPHNYEGYFTYMREFKNNFKTPFIWGFWLNLFSFKPIPAQAISWVLKHPSIARQIGAKWATVWIYKGIFIQSPILFAGVWGWFKFYQKKNKVMKWAVCFLSLVILSFLIPTSLSTQFWSPNIYDSRHLVAIVPIILLGIIGFDRQKKSTPYRNILLTIAFLVSFFSAFKSAISGFGPNLSGEHRYSFKIFFDLISQHRIHEAFNNLFPNMVNFHLLLLWGIIFYFSFVWPSLRFLERKLK